ncbi:hypothetical protein [Aquimarina agarivorans]|uniref:hypothetical protein n=1 Tax=Aquimarina agarivorans TaxID=980584 RepID=UPI000248F02D|nr:hypothetical protein [Aquimarina agarivorans]
MRILGISCGSDDSDDNGGGNANCNAPALIDQVAQGNFRGAAFTVQGGTYRSQQVNSTDKYFCRIHIKEQTGGSCAFPEFEGTNDAIIFSLPTLEIQTITYTDLDVTNSDALASQLSFNRIAEETSVELSCGTLNITELDSETNQLKGNVTAEGVEGSIINGNFVLDLCE